MNQLSLEKRVRIVAAAVEGNSERAIARLFDVSPNAVSRTLLWVGEACQKFHDEHDRNLPCRLIEMDELTSVVHGRDKKIHPSLQGSPDVGMCWTWTAIDPTSKFMVSWHCGKHEPADAEIQCYDLRRRLSLPMPQISADGLPHYRTALEKAFGENLSFATIMKVMPEKEWYQPSPEQPPVTGMRIGSKIGDPDEDEISTTSVERMNLTIRMQSGRYQKLSFKISKKLRYHRAALALLFMHYNYCRVHMTLRCTPAMELGVSDHIWKVDEIVALMAPRVAQRPKTYMKRDRTPPK